MKPVNKGESLGALKSYKDAKPDLLSRLGLHCSYCEQPGSPQNLHVEHIYPKDPHPEFEHQWDNFLIACATCNTYKFHHLGSGRQANMEDRYIWPHCDNTICAFEYYEDGRVAVASHLVGGVKQAAEDTLEMIGAMKSPAVAKDYEEDIAYDGMQKRREMWEIATEERVDYLALNSSRRPISIARSASKMGHFSIWMAVFHDRPEVLAVLIKYFKAAQECFQPDGKPVARGRI